MIVRLSNQADRIRLIAIKMKGVFGNEGALLLLLIRIAPEDFVTRFDSYAFRIAT
jgi:hypothetical protein